MVGDSRLTGFDEFASFSAGQTICSINAAIVARRRARLATQTLNFWQVCAPM
jgi:hypothetical protein